MFKRIEHIYQKKLEKYWQKLQLKTDLLMFNAIKI